VSLGRGIVEFVEHLGNESFAYLTIGGGQTIAAEVEAGSTLALRALELTTVPERLHFFDLATGDRLDLLRDVGSDNERTPVGAREIHGEGVGSDGDDD
jgi:hypothetical protein